MELTIMVVVVLFIMLGLAAIGLHMAFAMFVGGIIGLMIFVGPNSISALKSILWNTPNDMILVAVPLYLFMGEILLRIGISARLYNGLTPWLGRLPGGLLHTNIGACAIFAAVSGSSTATAATIGSIAIPELEKLKYDHRLTLGSVAAGGTLGILIPPSIAMIVYGALTGTSIGQLFMAGIIPGIMLALLFMAYIFVIAVINPKLTPAVSKTSLQEMFLGLTDLVPMALLVALVLGVIYAGITTPTEAAAIGVVGAIALGIAYRSISLSIIKDSLIEATRISCAIMIIYVGAKVLTTVFATMGLPQALANFVVTHDFSPMMVLLAVYMVYIIEGCFLDPSSMNVLTLPIVFPMISALGFDAVWFGIAVVVLIEIGLLTPPVGLNLFVLQGIAPQYKFEELVMGVTPFIVVQGVMLALLTIFPAIATWLPHLMSGVG